MKTLNTKKILNEFIQKHGLPVSVGATGWSQQECSYSLDDEDLGVAQESSKGWVYVRSDGKSDDGDSYYELPAYEDFDGLWEVVTSFISGKVFGDAIFIVDAEGERAIHLWDRDMDGKSWDFEPDDEVDIYSLIRNSLIERGEDADSIPEDDDDLDVQEFLDDCADSNWGDTEYDLSYAHALLEFADGTTVTMQKDSESDEIVITAVNLEDVDPENPFKG